MAEAASYTVTAYLSAGLTHQFPARDAAHAREIAGRIIREGLWIVNQDGSEEFYPTDRVFKVKAAPAAPATT